jgi:peptidylprolyl isomerase
MSAMIKAQSGLEYEDVKGIGGAPILHGQILRLEYLVALSIEDLMLKRNLLDSSEERENAIIITFGQTSLLKGVELGIEGMRKGDTRWLKIPPNLAFGKRGIPGIIPPNSTCFVEIYISTKHVENARNE